MSPKVLGLLILTFLVLSNGCAICCAPFDADYNCYGGIWDRADRANGRVGSRFQPAESLGQLAEANLGAPPKDVPHEARVEPTPDFDLE